MNKDHLFCLVVDDEPLAQQVLENYIQRIENLHLVAKCQTVQEAYSVLKSEAVDVIFLDLQLDSSSGLRLITSIDVEKDLRYYVVITSAAQRGTVNIQALFESKHFTFIDYLTKPFSFEQFYAAIMKILHDKGSSS